MSVVNKSVIIVAGGKGERMQTDVPKQFLEIKGIPILMRTISAFYNYENSIQVIVVLPQNQINFWESLCKKHAFSIHHEITAGGETRFHSVKNGLALIYESVDLIAIHDGVRPFVSSDTIERCFDSAARHGAAVPCVDLVDSIRELKKDKSRPLDRNEYKLVQTPQVFERKLLIKAYKQTFIPKYTDDAAVVEDFGGTIFLTDGNRENIKITTAFDLKVGECLS